MQFLEPFHSYKMGCARLPFGKLSPMRGKNPRGKERGAVLIAVAISNNFFFVKENKAKGARIYLVPQNAIPFYR